MAFLAQDPNQQQQDPNNPQANQVAGQGVTIGGGANSNGVIGGGQSGTVGANSSSGNSPKGTSSGSFTNLQNYVNANQGNDAQMGQAVTSTVKGAAGQADQAGSQFQTGAQQQLQSQTVNEDPNLVNSLKSGDVGNVDKDAFAKQYGAKYGGPGSAQEFAGYGDANKAYKNVETYGKEAAGDTADRGQLLQDTYGKGGNQYNQGERTLDSFVLGAGQQGAQALQNINKQYGNYGQNFQNIAGLVNQGIQKTQQTDQQTAQDVQNAAQTGFGALQGNLDKAADALKTRNDTAKAQYQALVDPNNPQHAAALKAAGLTDGAVQYLQSHGGNFNQYVNANQAYGLGDVANKSDISNYQNLANLINGVAPGAVTRKYDDSTLSASGGSDAGLRSGIVDEANQLAALNASLGARAAAANKDTSSLQGVLQSLAPGAGSLVPVSQQQLNDASSKLGVSVDDLQAARNLGIDPSQYFKVTGQEGIGDVASADDRTQFAKLSQLLNLSGGTLNTSGSPYSFDKAAFDKAYAAKQQAALANMQTPDLGPIYVNGGPQSSSGL